VGLLSVTTDIIWKITVSWEAGIFACKTIRFVQCLVTYGSTYVLVALSIDRYDAITHPMNFTGSCKSSMLQLKAYNFPRHSRCDDDIYSFMPIYSIVVLLERK
jgi:hypothetical protein